MIGPLIRLGPKLISVQGTEAIRIIYDTSSKWTKPLQASTNNCSQITSHGVLYTTPSLNDVNCRRILDPSFSPEKIEAQQHVILNCADTALTVTEIACENEEGKVDVLQIARTYAFDVISICILGAGLICSGGAVWRIMAGKRHTFRKEGSFEHS
jgi:cytochrome P450